MGQPVRSVYGQPRDAADIGREFRTWVSSRLPTARRSSIRTGVLAIPSYSPTPGCWTVTPGNTSFMHWWELACAVSGLTGEGT